MNADVYDKIYFKDEESRKFAQMRKQYGDRARSAMQRTATSNVTEWIDLRQNGDGGYTIHSTADFVSYFNSKYPRFDGKERISMIGKKIAEGQRRRAEVRADENFFNTCGEKSREKGKSAEKARNAHPFATSPRRFSLTRVIVCLLLVVCSIGILFGTSMALDTAEKKVSALEQEIETLQNAKTGEEVDAAMLADGAASGYTLSAADSVEVFTPAEKERTTWLGALALHGKKS